MLRTLRHRPSEALAVHRAATLGLLSDHGVEAALVYGSAAHGSDTVDSDLDLMVQFGDPNGDLLGLTADLADLLGVRVEVVDWAWKSADFVAEVLADGRAL